MASCAALPLALTMGDACGIGPEIIAAWFRSEAAGKAFVVGDVAVLRRAAASTGGMLPVARIERAADVHALPPRCIPVLQADGIGGLSSMTHGTISASVRRTSTAKVPA
jgi:4-hydroxythreonine-4-phosphate dehydrogenase